MQRVAALIVVASALAACGDASGVPAPAAHAEPAAPAVVVAPPTPPIVDRVVDAHELGGVPPEEAGAGAGSLRLRLRNADDDRPVAMYVRLWRLGVAESAAFLEGDQVQARLTVGVDGATIGNLPAGRYRVEVPDRRLAAVDPPEFLVGDGVAEQTLAVRPRSKHRVRLLLYDEKGAEIRRATGRIEHDDGVRDGPAEPPTWASPRASKEPEEVRHPPGRPSRCFFRREPRLPPLDAGPDGFDLGTLAEWGRYERPTVAGEVRVEGCNDVMVAGEGDLSGDVSVVGVCVALSTLLADVRLEDGTPLDVQSAHVFTACRTRGFAWNPPPDAWRSVPVFVSVMKNGFEDLRFTWTPETADRPHVLVASKPK